MNGTISDIIRSATAKGACALAKKVTDIRSLAGLFFSPQGKEFCEGNNFPSLGMFRRLGSEYDLAEQGVYVDSGAIVLRNKGNIALIGKTQATLIYEGTEHRYTVILMHGAKANIKARKYAVVEVVNIDCDVKFDIDKTVVLL